MSESCIVEVYENECFNRSKGWLPHPQTPFVLKANFDPCKPIDEITTPDDQWQWSTNWKFSKMPGVTDAEGWEYASRFARFKQKNRVPKAEAVWSRARRRLWSRVMRREAIVKNVDIPKITQKVQTGLTSIHQARVKIEEIMKQMPEAAETDQMRSLVTSVNRNIAELLTVIESAEKQCQTNLEVLQTEERNRTNNLVTGTPKSSGGKTMENSNNNNPIANTPAVLKKLKNDVLKEQAAIERALDPSIAASNEQYANNSNQMNPNPLIGNRNRNPSNPVPINNNGKPVLRSLANRGDSFTGSSSVSSSYQSQSSSYVQNRPGGAGGLAVNHRSSFGRSGKSDSISGPNDRRLAPTSGNGNSFNNTPFNNEQNQEEVSSGLSKMMSQKKVEVKSGSIGAFNPSLLISQSQMNETVRLNSRDEVEDGVFVDRTTQDMIIAQKLIPIDESTVMQEIIDERHTEIEKIHKGLVEINDLFKDLSKIVKEQEEGITTIYGNVEESHQKTKEAFAHIVEANRLQQTGNCILS